MYIIKHCIGFSHIGLPWRGQLMYVVGKRVKYITLPFPIYQIMKYIWGKYKKNSKLDLSDLK